MIGNISIQGKEVSALLKHSQQTSITFSVGFNFCTWDSIYLLFHPEGLLRVVGMPAKSNVPLIGTAHTFLFENQF